MAWSPPGGSTGPEEVARPCAADPQLASPGLPGGLRPGLLHAHSAQPSSRDFSIQETVDPLWRWETQAEGEWLSRISWRVDGSHCKPFSPHVTCTLT